MAGRAARIAAWGVLGIAGLLVLVVVALLVLARSDAGREMARARIERALQERVNGTVRVGGVEGDLLGDAALVDVAILDAAGDTVLAARRVEAEYPPVRLLRGDVDFERLRVVGLRARVEQADDGSWNVGRILRDRGDRSGGGGARALSIGAVDVEDARVAVLVPWRPAVRRGGALVNGPGDSLSVVPSRFILVPDDEGRLRLSRELAVSRLAVREIEGSLGDTGQVRARIDTLAAAATLRRDGVMRVRDLAATVTATGDSVWWRDLRLALERTHVRGDGSFGLDPRTLRLNAVADSAWSGDFAALLEDSLPEITGRLATTVTSRGGATVVHARDVALRSGDATLDGSGAATIGDTLVLQGLVAEAKRVSTALLAALAPGLKLDREGELDARVRADGPLDRLRVVGEGSFADRAAGTSRVRLDGELGMRDGVRARGLEVRAEPVQVALLPDGARVGGTITGRARVDGSAREGWSVRGSLVHRAATGTSRVSGSARLGGGSPVGVEARVAPLALATAGRLAPDLGLHGTAEGTIIVSGPEGATRVNADLTLADGGRARVLGVIDRERRDGPYSIDARLVSLDPRAASMRAPEVSLTGRVFARGRGFEPASLTAEVRATLDTIRREGAPPVSLSLVGGAAGGIARIDTLLALGPGTRLAATGTLGLVEGREGTLRFDGAADSLARLAPWIAGGDTTYIASRAAVRERRMLAMLRDSAQARDSIRIERMALGLPPLPPLEVDDVPGVRADSLGGRATVAGEVRGSVPRFALQARVEGDDVVARGFAAARVESDVRVRRAGGEWQGEAEGEADTVFARGMHYDAASWRVAGTDTAATVALELVQDERRDYSVRAAVARREGTTTVRFAERDAIVARFDSTRWTLAAPSTIRFDRGRIAIDSLELRAGPDAFIRARGAVGAPADSLRLDVRGLELAHAATAAQADTALGGTLSLAAILAEDAEGRAGNARLEVRAGRYESTFLPLLRATADYAADELRAAARLGEGAAPLLAAEARLPLLETGKVPGDRPFSVRVTADRLPLDSLPVKSDIADGLAGTLTGVVALGGTPDAPRLAEADLRVRDGAMVLVRTGAPLRGITASVRLDGDSLRVDSLVARNEGWARVSGAVSVADLENPGLRLAAAADSLLVFSGRDGFVYAGFDLGIVGALADLRVTGRADMQRSVLDTDGPDGGLIRLYRPGDPRLFAILDTSRAESDSLASLAEGTSAGVSARVDLRLKMHRGNWYRSSPDANVEYYSDGDIFVHANQRLGEAWLDGVAFTGRGDYVFRARAFRSSRGSLTFSPRGGRQPPLQIVAEHDVFRPERGWRTVRLVTGGDGRAPRLSLESGDPFPLRFTDASNDIALGRSYTSLLQRSGSVVAGEASALGDVGGEAGRLLRRQQAVTALGTLTHELGVGLARSLHLDIATMTPSDVPVELAGSRVAANAGAVMRAGRYVRENTLVTAQVHPGRALPGLRLRRLTRGGVEVDVGFESRFLVPEDLLFGRRTRPVRTGAAGLLFSKEWSF